MEVFWVGELFLKPLSTYVLLVTAEKEVLVKASSKPSMKETRLRCGITRQIYLTLYACLSEAHKLRPHFLQRTAVSP